MLSYDGQQFLGAVEILNKLRTLPSVKHHVLSADLQPTSSGVICFICGEICIDNDPNAIKFSQVFNIVKSPEGSYFCKMIYWIHWNYRLERHIQTQYFLKQTLELTLLTTAFFAISVAISLLFLRSAALY